MGRGEFSINLRKDRINLIENTIRKQTQDHGSVDKEYLLATVSYDQGIQRKKIIEYLKLLEALGRIKINKDEITHLNPNEDE